MKARPSIKKHVIVWAGISHQMECNSAYHYLKNKKMNISKRVAKTELFYLIIDNKHEVIM